LKQGRAGDAAALAGKLPRPFRGVVAEGIAHRESSREDLEEIMHEAILIELPRLERHLVFLSLGAVVSPLLGLLGTVTGMIHTFNLIEIFGTVDPRLLSGGISEALITTMAGLSVAIPLVLLHALLSRRVRTITDGLEKGAISFINTLKTREGATP
jgi:biopolymer transport protein ExbB